MDIRIENLNKSFGEHQILSNVCAQFPEGKVSAVLGQSGKGKTTLLRILCGLYSADSGTVFGMPEQVSVLFQEDRLFPQLDVMQNILALAPHDTSEEQIKFLLEKLGIADALHASVSELSGGMARRVSLARALLAHSEVLILDEPFRALDSDTRARTAQTVLEYAESKTVILFAHEQDEADLLKAQYILNMNI